jgi:hypothetical protein
MMQSTPEIKVKIRLCLAKCPKRQQNSPTNRNNVAKMKNSADLVTASGTHRHYARWSASLIPYLTTGQKVNKVMYVFV